MNNKYLGFCSISGSLVKLQILWAVGHSSIRGQLLLHIIFKGLGGRGIVAEDSNGCVQV